MTKLHPEIKEALYDPTNLKSEIEKYQSALRAKYPRTDIYFWERQGNLHLDMIIVPPKERKKGIGTKILLDIINFADKNNLIISLTPAQKGYQGATSTSRLKKFYIKYGFKQNKGYPEISDTLVRVPNQAVYDPESVQKAKDVLKYAVDKLFDPVAYDIPTLKRKLAHLRANRAEYLKHATPTDYREAIKDLKIMIKTSPLAKKKTKGKSKVLDPKKSTLTIKGDKKKMTRLAKHLAKEHPSTKGKMKVLDPAPKGDYDVSDGSYLWAESTSLPNAISRAEYLSKVGNGTIWILKNRKRIAEYRDGLKVYDPAKTKMFGKEEFRLSAATKNGVPLSSAEANQEYLENMGFATRRIKLSNGDFVVYAKLRNKKQFDKYYSRPFDPAPIKLHSGIPSRWFEAMVKGIKNSSDVRNPYAIVKNIWLKLSPKTKQDIKKREAAGEQFKYNLPLPDDRVTKGEGTLRMVKPFKLAEAQVNVSKKDMEAVKKSGIFKPMRRQDGSTCQVARCKGERPVNIFVDEV